MFIVDIFLKKIAPILFEPIAVAAVLGLVVCAVAGWKKRSAWYWTVAAVLLFMISWRVGIQIASARYAAALIYPAVIAAAFFCFQLGRLVRRIPRCPAPVGKYLPYVCLIGLVIGCQMKLFRINPYGDYVLKVARHVKEDAAGRGVCHILSPDDRRFPYYTGLPGTQLQSETDFKGDLYFTIIRDSIQQGPSAPADTVYVLLTESRKQKPGQLFRDVPAEIRKHIVFLGEYFHNKKRRRLTRIYRYDQKAVFALNVIPAAEKKSSGAAWQAFAFQKTYPENDPFYRRESRYFEGKGPDFQAPVLKDFPWGWQTSGVGGFERGSNGWIGCTGPEETLRLKADSLIAILNTQKLPAASFRGEMELSGAPGSAFSLAVHYYKGGAWHAFERIPLQEIPGTGRWIFAFRQPVLPVGAETMQLSFQLHKGDVSLHKIELFAPEFARDKQVEKP